MIAALILVTFFLVGACRMCYIVGRIEGYRDCAEMYSGVKYLK